MMHTNSFPNLTTMISTRKVVKQMAKYDNASSAPKMTKACTSGSKGMPKKASPIKTGKPSRTMY